MLHKLEPGSAFPKSCLFYGFDSEIMFHLLLLLTLYLISSIFYLICFPFGGPFTRLYRDIQHILGCIRSLPSGNLSASTPPNWGQLDEFLSQRFGGEVSQ